MQCLPCFQKLTLLQPFVPPNMEVTKKRKFNDSDDRENDDKSHTKKSTSTRVDSGQQAIIGPALPPTKQSLLDIHDELTAGNNSNDLDSDGESDDDDVGPTLPPPLTEQVQPGKVTDCASHRPSATPPEEQIHTTKKQRDEWMLQPPEKSDWTSKVDPTKLRHRKFQSGKSAGVSSTSRMDTSWLESPEQKMERMKDEVMGVKTSTQAENGGSSSEAPKITEAIQERIQKYNVSTR